MILCEQFFLNCDKYIFVLLHFGTRTNKIMAIFSEQENLRQKFYSLKSKFTKIRSYGYLKERRTNEDVYDVYIQNLLQI